jgi:CheY-like chemotaxis protein
MEVVAECADGTDALEAVRRLRPHVAVLDLHMPHPDGLEVARELHAQSNEMLTPAVVTISDLDEHVYAALRDAHNCQP